jgi:putative transposase
VRAHLRGQDDGLVKVAPALSRIERFADLLDDGPQTEERHAAAVRALRVAEGTGRPLGTADFVADLERRLGRPLARRAPGRKPAVRDEAQGSLL